MASCLGGSLPGVSLVASSTTSAAAAATPRPPLLLPPTPMLIPNPSLVCYFFSLWEVILFSYAKCGQFCLVVLKKKKIQGKDASWWTFFFMITEWWARPILAQLKYLTIYMLGCKHIVLQYYTTISKGENDKTWHVYWGVQEKPVFGWPLSCFLGTVTSQLWLVIRWNLVLAIKQYLIPYWF